MSEKRDPTHLGLSWPDAYAKILPVLRRAWGVDGKIYLSRQLGGGRSGALVFFVDISTASFAGQAILKLDQASDAIGQEQHEAALQDKAIEDAPKYAAEHLPRLLHSAHFGSQIAILSTIAGRGLEYVEPWTECSYERKLDAIRRVSTSLLEDWNGDYRLSEHMLMPQKMLRSWLDYRIDPVKGGRIHAFFDECGIAPDTPSVFHNGHWYPNPLAFLDGIAPVPKRVRLRAAIGHCHGDFHALNLLVGREEKKGLEYYLIDLALYESEQYLFYDHAYFEFTTLLNAQRTAPAKDWEAVIARLSRFRDRDDVPELRTEDIGFIELMQALRQGVTNWIERHEADRLSFMESQAILARVAVGLMFMHKRMPLDQRQRAFFYAASNLRDYLALHRLEWPKKGPVFEIGTVPQMPRDEDIPAEPAALPRTSASERAIVQPLSKPSRRQPALVFSTLVFAAVGLAVLLALVYALPLRDILWPGRETEVSSSSQTGAHDATGGAAPISLAVLPFVNLNADEDDDFVDGLSIDLASVLARTGEFDMPGMTSALRFKDNQDDPRAVGDALNVDYLVEGTVAKDDDVLTIAANLVRAADGFAVWSQTFQETLGNVFVTQERIAEAIGAALATPIDIDADVLEAERTEDPRAYELFVRGLALFERRGRALVDAIDVLEQATELNPDFAAAWGALSLVYNKVPTYLKEVDGRLVDPVVYYRKATEAALRGERIDSDLPLVRHAVAVMYQRERQWTAAQDEYEVAIRGDPTDNQVKADYARLLYIVGRRAEALALLDRAMELDPLVPAYKLWSAALRLQSDPTEENVGVLEDIFQRFPNLREFALRSIIDYRANTGQLGRARELIASCSDCSVALQDRALEMLEATSTEPAAEFFAKYKDDNILGYDLLYGVGGADLTLDAFHYYALGAKRRYGFHMVPWMRVDDLSRYERFLSIVADMGLVTYWRERGYPDNCIVRNERFVCADEDS